LYDPTTAAVSRTYAEEATIGVGTAYADLQAFRIKEAEQSLESSSITEDEYKNTPELYSEGIAWNENMTRESALITKEFNDAARKRQQILADASTSQAVAGFGVGFVAGVAEPKNLAVGVAASLALPGLGTAGFLGKNLQRAYQMRKTAKLGQRALMGAAEGVVAGAAVEPSNRYSAKILQQDYTMMDSLFNIATSTAFGAGLPVASKLIGDKVAKFRGRTMDVVTAEVDLATEQFASGQRVDVRAIETAEIGKLADKPVAAQVKAAESFVRFNESPEFKARFEGSKVVDAEGKPMMVYHGTTGDYDNIDVSRFRGGSVAGAYFTPDTKSIFLTTMDINGIGNGANIRPTYVDIKNPASFADYQRIEKAQGKKSTPESIAAQMKKEGFNGYIDKEQYNEIVAFDNSQIIPAFGDKSITGIIAQADTANAATIAKAQADALDPRNDTLIDYDTIDAMDERRAMQSAEDDAEAYYQQAEAEIRQMLADDILNEADLAEYRDALDELNSREPVSALETLKLCLTRG